MTRLLIEGTNRFIDTHLKEKEIRKAIKFWEAKLVRKAHVHKYRNKLRRVYIDLALNMKKAEELGYDTASMSALAEDIIRYYVVTLGISRTSLWRIRKNWPIEVGKIISDIKSGVVSEKYLEQFLSKRRKRFLYV